MKCSSYKSPFQRTLREHDILLCPDTARLASAALTTIVRTPFQQSRRPADRAADAYLSLPYLALPYLA